MIKLYPGKTISLCLVLVLLSFFYTIDTFANECIQGDCINGHGIYLYNSGKKYDGEWKNGERHGKGVLTYSYDAKYEGEWENDKIHGYGVKKYPDGSRYEGEWKKGIKHGFGIMEYLNTSKYSGEWKNGVRNGEGSMLYRDFLREKRYSVFKGEWKNGKQNGRGTHSYTGFKHIGEWKDGRKAGDGTIVCADGSRLSTSIFKKDKDFNMKVWVADNGFTMEEVKSFLDISDRVFEKIEKGLTGVYFDLYFGLKCMESDYKRSK